MPTVLIKNIYNLILFMLFEKIATYYERLEGISSRLEMIDVLTEMFNETSQEDIREAIYMTQGVLAPPFEGIEIGMAEKLAEQAIGRATGYKTGEIEANFKKTGDLGTSAEQFAIKSKLKRMNSSKFTVKETFDMLRKIALTSGAGSQDAKIRMMSELIVSSSPNGAKYIVRFAMGTLRLGVGDATIIEALSKAFTQDRKFKAELENAYNICSDLGEVGHVLSRKGKKGVCDIKVSLFKPIRPALAERLSTGEEILEKMHGKCAVESKYDGMRAQLHVDKKNNKVQIYSRRLENTTAMFPDICQAALMEIDANSAILEGEIIAYDEVADIFLPFQETAQRRRKHKISAKALELPVYMFAFDLMYLDGEDYMEKGYDHRRMKLESILKNGKMLKLADRKIVDNAVDLERYFTNAIDEGLEGVVAKELESKYVAGARKFSWIKLKRSYRNELSDTLDLVVVGYYLGKGAREEFKFGGILCATYNDKKDVFETVTRIGTGFTDKLLDELRGILSKIKTKGKPARVVSNVEPDFWVEPIYVVTVRADEITKSPTHTCGWEKHSDGTEYGYALRFPRIVSNGIREDKGAQDANTSHEVAEMYKLQKKTKLSS